MGPFPETCGNTCGVIPVIVSTLFPSNHLLEHGYHCSVSKAEYALEIHFVLVSRFGARHT